MMLSTLTTKTTMNDKTTKIRETVEAVNALMLNGNTYVAVVLFQKLTRLAKKHKRLCEAQCNGEHPFNSGAEEEQDLEFTKIEGKIKTLIDNSGARVEFQRDPRGATVLLLTPKNNRIGLAWL